MIEKIKKTINNFFKRILFKKNQRKAMLFVVFLAIILGIFFIGNTAQAGIGENITNILTWIIHGLVWVLGRALLLLIFILTPIAGYSDFVNSPPVIEAWHIVRDLCNMFFILILLIIAFATILRIESYNVKKALPKLLMMAVLINFSKSICGVFIDFAQVIMLTFVNSFQSLGQGNLTEMLGIAELLNFSYEKGDINALEDNSNKVTATSILGVYILALIYVLISIVVMAVIIGVLIMRIVMLWIYIVLSPLAYLLAAFPQGQKYASQWWGEFSKALVVGPMLAFFIWLSFTSLGDRNAGEIITLNGEKQIFSNAPTISHSKAGSANHMIKFGLSIGMLLGGLIVTQQVGGVFGNIAGKGMAAIQKGQGVVTGAMKKVAVGGTLGVLDYGNRKQMAATGLDLHMGRNIERIKAGWEDGKRKDLEKGDQAAQRNLAQGGALGMATGWSAKGYVDTFRDFKAPRQAIAAFFGHKLALSTKGITKKAVQDEEENRINERSVMTRQEFNKKKKSVAVNIAAETINKTKLETDLTAKEKEIGVAGISDADKKRKEAEADVIRGNLSTSNGTLSGYEKEQVELKAIGKRKDGDGNSVIAKNKTEAEQKRKKYGKKVEKAKKQISFYMDTNLDVVMQEKTARAEEKKKIGDIKDEDHIISLMNSAEKQGDFVRWGGLTEKLAEINGTNTLLSKEGYNVDTSGFSDEEYTAFQKRIGKGGADGKKAEKEYDKGKGWNDFMRQKGKDFGAQRQSVLRLQTDVGSIGEMKGAIHLQKTVGVDSSGQLKVNARKDRVKNQMIENNKRNVEKVLRDFNRLQHGGENADGSDYKFDEAGLAFITEHIDTVGTLLDGRRLNPSLAAAFSKKTAQKQLRKALKHMGKKEVKGKSGTMSVDDLFKRFESDAKAGKGQNFEDISKIARDER